jgi:hypothetical protein
VTRLLDARTSQNASYEQSISIGTNSIPAVFGQVGLQCIKPGGVIRVDFNASMTILFPINSPVVTILIQIVRGTQLTDLLVYSANLTIPGIGTDGALIFPFNVNGSDYNVPAPLDDQLIYTAFVSANSTMPSRIGPESFNAAAYCDF